MGRPTTKAEWAALHLRQGFTIIPAKANSKDCLPGEVKSHVKNTSAHWAKKTNDNIKALIQLGQICLDFDARHNGVETYERLYLARLLPDSYTDVTRDSGKHVWYRVPADFKTKNVFELAEYPGVEFKGAGLGNNHVTMGGSVVEETFYDPISINETVVDAPDWLVELYRQNLRTEYKPEALSPAPIPSTTTSETTEPKPDKVKGWRPSREVWAEAALIKTLEVLADAKEGTRFDALVKASVSMGNLVHIIDQIPDQVHYSGYTEDQLKTTVSDWANPNKVTKTIETGLAKGALKPREPDVVHEKVDRDIHEALAAMEDVLDSISWGGKFEGPRGNVRALGVREALKVIIHKAKEHGSLNVIASIYWVAKQAYIGKTTADKILKAADEAGLITFVAESSKAKANIYHLTAKGFNTLLKLRELEKRPKTVKVINNHTEKETLKSASLPVGNTLTVLGRVGEAQNVKKTLQAFTSLGIFGQRELGRPAKLILERLAERPATTVELEALTGLGSRTIRRALERLEESGFIDRGDRATPHALKADDLNRLLMLEVEARQMGAKVNYRETKAQLLRDNYRKQKSDPAAYWERYFAAKSALEDEREALGFDRTDRDALEAAYYEMYTPMAEDYEA